MFSFRMGCACIYIYIYMVIMHKTVVMVFFVNGVINNLFLGGASNSVLLTRLFASMCRVVQLV